MKKMFEKDSVLKIMALLISIVIWLYITVVVNPFVEVTVRDIPIQFIGEEVVEANNLSIVSESLSTVTVKVKGNRRRMGSYDMKSIIAKVDMSGITYAGTVELPIDIVVPFEHESITSTSAYSVSIVTEKSVEKTLDIVASPTGRLADGFMPGDIKIEPKTVTIKGAESLIGKIGKATVNFSYNNADVDIDVDEAISLYGVNGEEITARDVLFERIHKNIDTAKVHCPVLKLKKVGVDLRLSGDTNGKKYSAKPSSVLIYAPDGLTANIESVQTENIDVNSFKDKDKIKVKLVIPTGIKVLEDIAEVEVVEDNNP